MQLTNLAAIAVTTLFVTDAMAQRGGRWRAPEEITNRTGLFFTDVAGPETDGDKVADLGTIEFVRAAISSRQLSVLYLVNSDDDEKTRQDFEWQVARDPELGIELRCFHCAKIDLAKDEALAKRFAKKAPLFVVFDEKGKSTEVSMSGYKPSSSSLKKALEKAAAGAMKPALPTFAKKYGKFVRELEALLRKRDEANGKLAKAGGDNGKRKKIEKELAKLAAAELKLKAQERDLLGKARLPERDSGAKRFGERPRRDRGRGENGRGGRGGN